MAILNTHIDPRDVYPQIARLLNLPPEMCWRKCTITFDSMGLITADYEGYQAKKPETPTATDVIRTSDKSGTVTSVVADATWQGPGDFPPWQGT